MRQNDAAHLIHFNARMGMYIVPDDRDNIVSYLHGYENGTDRQCAFTGSISQHLEQRYKIKKNALGWPGQIQRFAEKLSLSWRETYLLISSEVLLSFATRRRKKGE